MANHCVSVSALRVRRCRAAFYQQTVAVGLFPLIPDCGAGGHWTRSVFTTQSGSSENARPVACTYVMSFHWRRRAQRGGHRLRPYCAEWVARPVSRLARCESSNHQIVDVDESAIDQVVDAPIAS
jgi:hypothetical protein